MTELKRILEGRKYKKIESKKKSRKWQRMENNDTDMRKKVEAIKEDRKVAKEIQQNKGKRTNRQRQ